MREQSYLREINADECERRDEKTIWILALRGIQLRLTTSCLLARWCTCGWKRGDCYCVTSQINTTDENDQTDKMNITATFQFAVTLLASLLISLHYRVHYGSIGSLKIHHSVNPEASNSWLTKTVLLVSKVTLNCWMFQDFMKPCERPPTESLRTENRNLTKKKER